MRDFQEIFSTILHLKMQKKKLIQFLRYSQITSVISKLLGLSNQQIAINLFHSTENLCDL